MSMWSYCAVLVLIVSLSLNYLLTYAPINPMIYKFQENAPELIGNVLDPQLEENKMKIIGHINATMLGLDAFNGPESFGFDPVKNYLYTGISDGRIVRIEIDTLESKVVTRMGSDHPGCGEGEFEHICGRPLGVHVVEDGKKLLVADAYFGIFFVDAETGEKELLADEFGGIKFHFCNVALIKGKSIFFTDTSKYHRRDFGLDLLEKMPYGILYEYDMVKKTVSPVSDGFYFANGIAFLDEDHILVVETAISQISKVKITGSKKEKSIWAKNIPCTPDNIVFDKSEDLFWVGCAKVRKAPFSLLDFLNDKPVLRKLLSWLPKEFLIAFAPKYDIILGFSKTGQIIKSKQDPSGPLDGVSEAFPINNKLYLGSFKNPGITIIQK